ncbi:DUF3293 domain-containing protein [Alcaligenes sp. SDU_A2]|uniref:DUF3293 domain-containing protein n=1 Tax=Alcaligenes sp. SDU_A2 TaxID=3136634 RepID=UPI00311FF49B
MLDKLDLPASLSKAFEQAIYQVHSPAGDLTLRIGTRHARLAQLLRQENCRGAAILTAHNPQAQRCGDHFNLAAQETLLRALQQQGMRWWPAVNQDPEGQWPNEPGFLILDISLHQARLLARLAKQLAFVYIEPDGVARLHQVQQRLPAPAVD